MRYVLYFFTLALVFTAGMLVGNFYVPDHSSSLAAAVSVPDMSNDEALLSAVTPEQAQQTLQMLTQALSACPVVVQEEQAQLFNQISLFLAVQDFRIKKSIYEAEIAKNITENRPTAQFNQAAADYTAAKARVEQLVSELFPPAMPETSNEQTAPEAAQEPAPTTQEAAAL